MVFKGRTVLLFVLLGVVASSLVTLTAVRANLLPAVSTAGVAAQADGLSQKDLQKVATTYELIRSRSLASVDHDKIMNGAINGMLQSLDDPFSTYMNAKEAQQFQESINSSFQGIGAEVSLNENRVTIVAPIKGSPAEKAGLQANDVILSVNGEKLDGLSLNEAVSKIRGKKGSEAKLQILRSGSTEPVDVVIVRDDIPVETVHAEMVTPTIGKIEITQFSSDTSKRFKEELVKLESKGMKGLLIDVRNDPGGLLDQVEKIAEIFVEKGKTIVQIEDKQGNREKALSESKEPARKYPVSVLINNGSASASEILAGALKESVGSKLIGERTYGKGTVQITFEKEMGDGSNIKMTVFKWLTPNGNWINKTGIEPDLKVEQPAYFKVSPFTKKSVLKYDATGDDVKTLQLILTGLGYAPGRTDGYFSEKTASELKAYQAKAGLAATGEADVKTMSKLEQDIILQMKNPAQDAQLKAALQDMQETLKSK
ncbi:peptidase S41 [Paenibacillus sp. J31TS4]|uniref:S41 family peptidase n=1 Tax=Paenibacillus sp. J31TS4 TaxID=2807195 RepID=UPI001B246E6E|nr:S41 family peptidase [Paenibacillus sp. J31TS4]GIP41012.1 peptidase S41 [Paenibacillus sp. J31TS4]